MGLQKKKLLGPKIGYNRYYVKSHSNSDNLKIGVIWGLLWLYPLVN